MAKKKPSIFNRFSAWAKKRSTATKASAKANAATNYSPGMRKLIEGLRAGPPPTGAKPGRLGRGVAGEPKGRVVGKPTKWFHRDPRSGTTVLDISRVSQLKASLPGLKVQSLGMLKNRMDQAMLAVFVEGQNRWSENRRSTVGTKGNSVIMYGNAPAGKHMLDVVLDSLGTKETYGSAGRSRGRGMEYRVTRNGDDYTATYGWPNRLHPETRRDEFTPDFLKSVRNVSAAKKRFRGWTYAQLAILHETGFTVRVKTTVKRPGIRRTDRYGGASQVRTVVVPSRPWLTRAASDHGPLATLTAQNWLGRQIESFNSIGTGKGSSVLSRVNPGARR